MLRSGVEVGLEPPFCSRWRPRLMLQQAPRAAKRS